MNIISNVVVRPLTYKRRVWDADIYIHKDVILNLH